MFRRRANVSITGTPIILDDNKEAPSAYDINAIPVIDKTYYGISAKYQTTVSYKATQRLSGTKFELVADKYTIQAINRGLPFEPKIQRDLVFLEVGGKYVGPGFIFDEQTALFDAKSGSSYPNEFYLPPTKQDIIDEYASKGLERPIGVESIIKQRTNAGTPNGKYLTPYFVGNPGYYTDSPEMSYENIPTKATPIKIVKSSKTLAEDLADEEWAFLEKKVSKSFSFELVSDSPYIRFNKPGRGQIYIEELFNSPSLSLEAKTFNSLSLSSLGVVFYLNWEVSPIEFGSKKFMKALKVYAVDNRTGQRSPIIDLKSNNDYGLPVAELNKVSAIGDWFRSILSQRTSSKLANIAFIKKAMLEKLRRLR